MEAIHHTTNFSMDWNNLQFKAKDLILFAAYIIAGMLFIGKITNSIERLTDTQVSMQAQFEEFKNDSKGMTKETQVFWQNLQNQVNANSTQIRLQDQRLTMLETQINKLR